MTRKIKPEDLGVTGYTTMLSSSDGDEQVMILAKPRHGSIHDRTRPSPEARTERERRYRSRTEHSCGAKT